VATVHVVARFAPPPSVAREATAIHLFFHIGLALAAAAGWVLRQEVALVFEQSHLGGIKQGRFQRPQVEWGWASPLACGRLVTDLSESLADEGGLGGQVWQGEEGQDVEHVVVHVVS
jgi:hypothetical protein